MRTLISLLRSRRRAGSLPLYEQDDIVNEAFPQPVDHPQIRAGVGDGRANVSLSGLSGLALNGWPDNAIAWHRA